MALKTVKNRVKIWNLSDFCTLCFARKFLHGRVHACVTKNGHFLTIFYFPLFSKFTDTMNFKPKKAVLHGRVQLFTLTLDGEGHGHIFYTLTFWSKWLKNVFFHFLRN